MARGDNGRQIYTGTIASGASFAYLQPIPNGAGVYEVAPSQLLVSLTITIVMGATVPSTRGVVVLYVRKRSGDTRWDERKTWQTPTIASKTQPFTIFLDPTIYQYKLSATGGTGQPFDIHVEEGAFNP